MSLSDVDELVYSWTWRKGGREATIKPSSLSIIKTANKPNQMSLSGVVELVYSWAWRACLLVSLSGVDKLFYSWAWRDGGKNKPNQVSLFGVDELGYSWAWRACLFVSWREGQAVLCPSASHSFAVAGIRWYCCSRILIKVFLLLGSDQKIKWMISISIIVDDWAAMKRNSPELREIHGNRKKTHSNSEK